MTVRWMKFRKKEGRMRDKYQPKVGRVVFITIALLLTGCSGNHSETEFHPSGEISEKLEEGTRVLYDYDAEDKSQTLYFGACGDGRLFWQKEGHDSDNCFRVGSRKNERDGVFLMLEDKDVIGKWLYVSFWTRHEAKEALAVGCTLQIQRPDSTVVEWPESVWTEPVPSGRWVYVEGKIPVYADALLPQLNFEADGTEDFMLDNIRITVDDGSVAKIGYRETDSDMEPFSDVFLDFENGETYFSNRGNGTGTITTDAYSGEKALLVDGRTESWHGVEKDFFGTQTEGKTIEVSCYLKNNADRPAAFAITLAEEKVSGQVVFGAAAQTEEVAAGEWIRLEGRIPVSVDTVRPVLYFESRDASASFILDDVEIKVSEKEEES